MNNLGRRRPQPANHARHHSTNHFNRNWERTVAPHYHSGRLSTNYINPTFASVVFHRDEKKSTPLQNYQTTNTLFYSPAPTRSRTQAPDQDAQSHLSTQKSHLSARSRSRYAEDFAHPALHPSSTPQKGNFFTANPEPTPAQAQAQAQAPAEEVIIAVPRVTPGEALVRGVEPRLREEIVYMEQEEERGDLTPRRGKDRRGWGYGTDAKMVKLERAYQRRRDDDLFGEARFSPDRNSIVNNEELGRYFKGGDRVLFQAPYAETRPVVSSHNHCFEDEKYAKLAEGREVDLHEEKDFLGEVEVRKREKVRQELEFRDYLKEVDEYHKVKAEKRFTDTKVERALACAETIRENQKVLIRAESAYKSGIKESKGQYLDFLKKQAQLDSLNRQINLKQEQETERDHKGLIDNLTRNSTSKRPGHNADLEMQIYEQEKILSELKDWNTNSEQDFQTTRDNYYDKYVTKQHKRTKDRPTTAAMHNQLEEMAEKRQT